ncbi:hypothetical protein VCHC41A1_1268, partial [Vibrio cholerae HC-41A1]
MARLADSG